MNTKEFYRRLLFLLLYFRKTYSENLLIILWDTKMILG
jgi:hypothetical protein